MRIGISMRVTEEHDYVEIRDALANDWFEFFESEFPKTELFLIPNNTHQLEIILNTHQFDGFIFSGGNDLNAYPVRDYIEKSILDFCINKNIPCLGVCRGMQIISEYFNQSVVPIQDKNHTATSHEITLVDNKILLVNSYHNMKVELKEEHPFHIIARSLDDTIEAIEDLKKQKS